MLKQFFLDHFSIKTIIGSWAEPWFDDAAVNCVITVLERQPDAEKRNNTKTSFVKLNKPFKELVPFGHEKFESYERWKALDYLERIISTAQYFDDTRKEINIINDDIRSFENPQMRIRMVNQSYLAAEVAEKEETSKWGKFLRAPDVYFEILDTCKDKLKPLKDFASIKRGYTTGLNEFFYLKLIEPLDLEKRTAKVQNGAGYICEIEHEYLKKVIKSPKDSQKIVLDETFLTDTVIFICNKTMDELLAQNHFGARNYIEYGETQRNKDGIAYTKVTSVQSRKNWYALKDKLEFSDFIIPSGLGENFKIFENKSEILVDKVMTELFFTNENAKSCINSTLTYLFAESNSRVNLGDGLLFLAVYEVEELLISDATLFSKELISKINKIQNKINKRKIASIYEEVKQKDRIELDTLVLEALGLDAKKILPQIYEGLCKLVKERVSLPEMRKSNKKQKVVIAYNDIKKSVIKDIIPNGFRHFPDAFIDFKSIKTTQIPTSGKPLSVQSYLMGSYILEDNNKQTITDVYGEAMKDYVILFTRLNFGKFQIIVPEDTEKVIEVINLFKKYTLEITEQVRLNAYQKLHDWNLAEKMANEIVGECEKNKI